MGAISVGFEAHSLRRYFNELMHYCLRGFGGLFLRGFGGRLRASILDRPPRAAGIR